MLKMSVMFGLIVIFGVGLMIIGDEVGGPGSGNVGKVSGKGGKVMVSLTLT